MVTLSLHSTASHSYHTRKCRSSTHLAAYQTATTLHSGNMSFTPLIAFSFSIAALVMSLFGSVPHIDLGRLGSHLPRHTLWGESFGL